MKRISILITGILLSFSSWAISLDDAKTQGLVGEQLNGYLGQVTQSSDPEVKSLIKEINGKRKQIYQSIAKKNGISLEQVSALAGEKAIKKTPAKQYVQGKNGQWKKK